MVMRYGHGKVVTIGLYVVVTLDPLYCLFTCLMPSGAQQYAP